MQLANLIRANSCALLLVAAGTAQAQTPPPPIAPVDPAASSAALPAVGASQPASNSLAARARAIAIGQPEGDNSTTLKEVLRLQQKVYLNELRAKLNEPGSGAPVMAPGGSTSPSSDIGVHNVTDSSRAAPKPAAPVVIPDPVPAATLNSVIISGVRARADVSLNGVVSTVKEGDKIDGWTVTSITRDAVEVQMTRTTPALTPVVATKAAGKVKTAPAPVVKTFTAKLQPTTGMPVAAAVPATGAQAAVVPPLPAPLRQPVDSTSIPPAVPVSTAR